MRRGRSGSGERRKKLPGRVEQRQEEKKKNKLMGPACVSAFDVRLDGHLQEGGRASGTRGIGMLDGVQDLVEVTSHIHRSMHIPYCS